MTTPRRRRARTSTAPPLPGIVSSEPLPPPTSGPYAYGVFAPGAPDFPVVGGSYIDPVFATTIVRLTDEVGQQSFSDIYSKNGYFNADATLMVHNTPTGRRFINPRTGAVLAGDVPGNDNSCFDPVDPDAWWWYDFGGSTLYRASIAARVSTAIAEFADPIGNNGGSIDWIDRTGRYMVLHLGDTWRLYDVRDGVLYDNPIPDSYGSDPGYTGISPDGAYIITTKNGNPNDHRSWKVDHLARRVATDSVTWWTLCGDHADYVSASNGRTYAVIFECDAIAAVYAVDIGLAQSHDDKDKQLREALQLFTTSWSDSGHMSRVSRGPLADWCYVTIESGDDDFATTPTWRAYMSELLMVNVLTGEVRRLAHHRSRSLGASYYHQPRVSASWDGSVVAWASNMGRDDCNGYVDIYALLVTASTPPPDPEPPDPEPEPEPEPDEDLRLYRVEYEGAAYYVEAVSLSDAIGRWQEHSGADDEPRSVVLLSDAPVIR